MEIEVFVGENFIVALYSNPTTGYKWEAEYDSDFVELIRQGYYVAPSVASGGLDAFEFRPYKVGETHITMSYKRPWEGAPIRKEVYKIKIK
jgi:inhibitor of cysteine peptidase